MHPPCAGFEVPVKYYQYHGLQGVRFQCQPSKLN
jgi:hypothetical protein